MESYASNSTFKIRADRDPAPPNDRNFNGLRCGSPVGCAAKLLNRLPHNGAMANLYESDTYAWALDQAKRIRSGKPIDTQNVAEEIEDLGKRQRSFLVYNLEVLVMHMLKWDYQADKRSKSWMYTIMEHRNRVNDHLIENPSLKGDFPELLSKAYTQGRLKAAAESGLDLEAFPADCPYSWKQISTDQ